MLKISNLTKKFRGVTALNDFSAEILAGKIISVVGDNGAGKSTLMKCISGNLIPDSGRVVFDSTELTGLNPAECRHHGIAMVHQDLALCKQQDLVTNIFLGQELTNGFFLNRTAMRKQAETIFESLGVEIPFGVSVGSLSGGQQQIIALSRAMISDPKLLILDEPTAALGVQESRHVLEYIKRVNQQGVTILMISHNLPDILELSDSIFVMRHGYLKYALTPDQTDLKDLIAKIAGD